MRNLNVIILVFLFGAFYSSNAQTFIYGTRTSDEVWTKEGNPYLIIGKTIFENSNLTIEAGVTVDFNVGEMEIGGDLFIQGKENDSVNITTDNSIRPLIDVKGEKIDISYLHLKKNISGTTIHSTTADTVRIQHSSFEHSAIALNIETANYISIDFVEFNSIGYPIIINNSNAAFISNCLFKNYALAINLNSDTNTEIVACEFFGMDVSTNDEFEFYSTAISGKPKLVKNSYFEGNAEALRISGGTFLGNRLTANKTGLTINDFKENYGDIKNNTFCDNEEYDLYNNSFFDFEIDSNCFCGRTESQIKKYDFANDPNKGKITFPSIKSDCRTYTCLPSEIITDLVLTKQGSPYTICEETILYPGITLEIEPGVDLLFENRLNVRGHLKALGTEADSILFDTKYPFPVYDAIFVEGLGQLDLSYLRTVGNSPTMIKYASSSHSTISNVYFHGHQQAISMTSGRLNLCDSRFKGGWAGVSFRDVDSSVVSNCVFENQWTAITSRNSINVIKNCTIRNMDRHGIQVGGGAILSHNVIEYCTLGGISIEGAVKIYNNEIHNNAVGIEFSPSYQSGDVDIQNNLLCNGTSNINFQNIEGISVDNNCWCVPEEQISSTLSGANGVVFSPVANACEVGLETNRDCSTNFSNPNDDPDNDGFSIKGTVYEGVNKLSNGYVFLYSTNGAGVEPVAFETVTNGLFEFKNIEEGNHTILAGPLPGEEQGFVPTFYAEKKNNISANSVHVEGDVFGITLNLDTLSASALGTSSAELLHTVGDYSEVKSYPMLLLDPSTLDILGWSISKGGEYSNFRFDNLFDGEMYSLLVPKNGRMDDYYCFGWSNQINHKYIPTIGKCLLVNTNPTQGHLITTIFPNPATDVLTIQTNTNEKASYRIIEECGLTVIDGMMSTDENIDVSGLSAGFYMIQIQVSSGIITKPFLKQ